MGVERILEGLRESEVQSGTHNDPTKAVSARGSVPQPYKDGYLMKVATLCRTIEGDREGGPDTWLHETAATDPRASMPKSSRIRA
jgi:hypothetical protein